MAVDITLTDVIGTGTIDDGGYVGGLLKLARAHVAEAITNNELTQSEAGAVYTAMIPAAMQSGIEFAMQEALTEEKVALTNAQTASVLAETIMKQALNAEQVLLTTAQTAHANAQSLQVAEQTLLTTAQTASVLAQTAMQEALNAEKVLLTTAQTALATRQAKGFDDDAKQKLLKQALDSWSVAYSVAKDANAIPDAIKVNPIDSIMKNAMDSLSIVKTVDPLGEV